MITAIVSSVVQVPAARDIRHHRLPIMAIRTRMLIRTLTDTIRLRFFLDLAMEDSAGTAEVVSGARKGSAAEGPDDKGPFAKFGMPPVVSFN